MSPLAGMVIVLGLFFGGMAAGIKVHAGLIAQRDLKIEQATAREALRKMDRIDVAAVKHENYKTEAAIRERIVKVEVDRVVQSIVYSNVCLDDSGLQLLADDIAARPVAGKPARAVSSPADPDAKGRAGGAAVVP